MKCRVHDIHKRPQPSHTVQGRDFYACIPQPITSPPDLLRHMHLQVHAIKTGPGPFKAATLTAPHTQCKEGHCVCSVAVPHGTAADKVFMASGRLLDIPVQESSVEVVPDCVIHKTLLQLGLSSFLVSKDHVIVPPSLHLHRGDTMVTTKALYATGSCSLVSTTILAVKVSLAPCSMTCSTLLSLALVPSGWRQSLIP